MPATTRLSSLRIKPSLAWLVIFLPALAYYMVTRLYAAGLFRGSTVGQIVETTVLLYPSSITSNTGTGINVACTSVESIFYITTTSSSSSSSACKLPILSSSSSSASSASSSSNIIEKQPHAMTLKHPLYLVQEDLDHVVATCWRHNEELGRGFLLLSTAGGQGRVWRWETGGGPIAIGRTLSVERSGCRSSLYQPCLSVGGSSSNSSSSNNNDNPNNNNPNDPSSWLGSGGIAMDSMSSNDGKGGTSKHSHFAEGKLVVAEWGEGRIARMEENGARTPLVIQVPMALCSDNNSNNSNQTTTTHTTNSTTSLARVHQPRALLFSPFGDLFFFSHHPPQDPKEDDIHNTKNNAKEHGESSSHQCNGDTLLQLRQSIWIEPLSSLHVSRQAHSWTSMANANDTSSNATNEPTLLPKIRFHAAQLGGMTLDTTWVNMYVTAKQSDGTVVLLSMPLGEDEEDDDDDTDDKCDAVEMENDDDLADKACKNKPSSTTASPLPSKNAPPVVVLDYSEHASHPGPVAIDKLGRIFLASTDGVLVVVAGETVSSSNQGQKQKHHQIVAHLATPQTPTALTVGDDGFLYIATDTLLLRIRVQQGPVQVPTDLVFQKKKR